MRVRLYWAKFDPAAKAKLWEEATSSCQTVIQSPQPSITQCVRAVAEMLSGNDKTSNRAMDTRRTRRNTKRIMDDDVSSDTSKLISLSAVQTNKRPTKRTRKPKTHKPKPGCIVHEYRVPGLGSSYREREKARKALEETERVIAQARAPEEGVSKAKAVTRRSTSARVSEPLPQNPPPKQSRHQANKSEGGIANAAMSRRYHTELVRVKPTVSKKEALHIAAKRLNAMQWNRLDHRRPVASSRLLYRLATTSAKNVSGRWVFWDGCALHRLRQSHRVSPPFNLTRVYRRTFSGDVDVSLKGTLCCTADFPLSKRPGDNQSSVQQNEPAV